MMARDKSGNAVLRNIFLITALLQIAAWGCDIFENCCLLKWINNPAMSSGNFRAYHIIVGAKWIIALSGVLLGVPFALRKRQSRER
jgi:hypothetical protein